jgi:polyisoprenoid-binding protein YceI
MKRTAFALFAIVASTAHAIEYNQVQSDKSSVGFSYKQMNVGMDGKFSKFASQLSFDPAQPAKAQVTFDLDIASVDTGSSEADAEVAGKPWFNTKAFPTARFVSTAVKPLANNRYEVVGTLSIKGKTQSYTLPVTYTPQGKSAVFDGSFILRRGDFSIGEGAWAAFDIVANDVAVKFRITANAK